MHVCSACRRPSRENARRLAAGQPATQVMTEAISVPAGNGAVAYVPSRIQPEPLPAIAPTPSEVPLCEHGLSVEGCGPCTVAAVRDPAELATLWATRPELRAHSGLFGARGRELNEEWTTRIADASAEELADQWDRFSCVPELEELGRAKWSLSNGGVNGKMIAVEETSGT